MFHLRSIQTLCKLLSVNCWLTSEGFKVRQLVSKASKLTTRSPPQLPCSNNNILFPLIQLNVYLLALWSRRSPLNWNVKRFLLNNWRRCIRFSVERNDFCHRQQSAGNEPCVNCVKERERKKECLFVLETKRMRAVWPDWSKFRHYGAPLKNFGHFKSIHLALLWANLGEFYMPWANFHCCKWQNILAVWLHWMRVSVCMRNAWQGETVRPVIKLDWVGWGKRSWEECCGRFFHQTTYFSFIEGWMLKFHSQYLCALGSIL